LNIHIDDIHPGITFTQVSHSPRYRIHPGITFTQVSHSPRYRIHPGITFTQVSHSPRYLPIWLRMLRTMWKLCKIECCNLKTFERFVPDIRENAVYASSRPDWLLHYILGCSYIHPLVCY